MKRDQAIRGAVFVALVAVAVAVRLVSETPNFNAVMAAGLFAGFYFRSRLTAVCVPVLAMITSDLLIGGYAVPMMVAVYLSLGIPIAWRGLLRRQLSPLSVGTGAVSAALAHYVLSNLAVWYFWYPHTSEGFTRCFTVALPFLANALAGNVLFAAGFFGLYAMVLQLREEPTAEALPEAA